MNEFADPGVRIDRAAWQQQRLSQLILLHQHQARAASGLCPLSFADVGFSVNSQNDEDGVLLFAFALVGFKTRIAVEMAAGDGIECNSANLLLHHGFTGLLFEGESLCRCAPSRTPPRRP